MFRDVKTLRARAKDEGDSFITITLPEFCRDFERSLAEGRLSPGAFPRFKKWKSTGMPAFLRGFLSQIFAHDGSLLATPSIDCIRFVRQICLFGKKVERPCSDERESAAIEAYKRCDDEVAVPSGPLWDMFKRVARILIRDLPLDRESLMASVVPQHGPGATQERLTGNSKWRFTKWHRRLDMVGLTHRFCMWGHTEEYDLYMHEHSGQFPESPSLVEPEDEKPVRVVFVPKTLKTPRVIAVEPVCMQFAQQGLMRVLVRLLSRSRLTAGHVNFTDQSVNQALALEGSGTGQTASLDMSEASDRVGVAHVQGLLASHPDFLEMVLASRSMRAELPNGEVLTLKKFASMGSALCFPIEALVFFTSIIASRLLRAGVYPTEQSVYSFGRSVHVFGDDLIVPADEAPAICDDLEALGFKVNRHKSFWTGKFRESCGSDCYDNELVTPVYLRRDLPTNRKDATGILSCLSTANQLQEAGYWVAATALRSVVTSCLGYLPQVPHGSPALGWNTHSECVLRRRWNRHLQRVEYLAWTTVSLSVDDPLDGYAALAKCFRRVGKSLNEGDLSAILSGRLSLEAAPDHLEVSSRPYSLALKRRWVPLQ